MNVRSLKIFCDIVSLRSFSKAANENGVSQSNASHVVHQLEERLGVELIDRSTRPFGVTLEGQRYYDGCRGIVRRYYDLEEEVRSLGKTGTTRLKVAAIFSVGFGHMNKCLEGFRQEHANVDVRMEYLHSDRVYAAVESDEADLGIVGFPESTRKLGVIPWRDERLVLVAAPNHPLASQPSASLKSIDGQRLITLERGLKFRDTLDKELTRRNISVEVAAEFDNIETVKRAIEAGGGIGILPAPTISSELAAGTLAQIAIEGQPLVRPLGVIFRRDQALPEAAEQLVDHLKACAARNGSPPQRLTTIGK